MVQTVDYTDRGTIFAATVNGRQIARSPTPFFDACRALLAEGVPPGTPVVMRHSGQDHDALRSTVGAAAKLTMKGDRGFQKWRPFGGIGVSAQKSLEGVS